MGTQSDVTIFLDLGTSSQPYSGNGLAPGTPLIARIHASALDDGHGLAGPFTASVGDPNGNIVHTWPGLVSNEQGLVEVHFVAELPTGTWAFNAMFDGSERNGISYQPSSASRPYVVSVNSGGNCGGANQPTCPPPPCGGLNQPTCPPPPCGGLNQPTCPPPPCGGLNQPTCPPPPCGGLNQPTCNNGPVPTAVNDPVWIDPGTPLPPPGQGGLPGPLPAEGVLPGTPLVTRVHVQGINGTGNGPGVMGPVTLTLFNPNGGLVWTQNFQTTDGGIVDVRWLAALPVGVWRLRVSFAGAVNNGFTYLPSENVSSYSVRVPNNLPPIAATTGDQTVYRTSPAGAWVTLDGTGSSDPDGSIAGYFWYEVMGGGNPDVPLGSGAVLQHEFALGNHIVGLKVIDNGGLRSGTLENIHVLNVAPVAVAGVNRTIECVNGGAFARLDGTGSHDIDGFIANYSWTSSAGSASGAISSLAVPMGTTNVNLIVRDNDNATGSTSTSVTVVDTQSPEITGDLNATTLWSPNHKMVKVASGISATDACGSSGLSLNVSVTSNQPVNATGDGNTSADWQVVANSNGTYDVYVRSERSGDLNDRIYTITAVATDGSGNTKTETATVTVPHNR